MRKLVLTLLIAGCGAATEEPPQNTAKQDFAAAPAPSADTLELKLAEQIIPPGEERIICHYLEKTTQELLLTEFKGYQGKFGHHVALFEPLEQVAPGTVRDCSEAKDMLTLMPILADVELSDGLAVKVPAGTQIVLQSHYVNTTQEPIAVRDVAHLRKTTADQVTDYVGFLGLSDVWINIPSSPEVVRAFECEVPFDARILSLGAHMHEWGKRFAIDVVRKDGTTERPLSIEPWTALMRDHPPEVKFGLESPLMLRAGDKLRTECVYHNDTATPLEFPKEMCATFGFFVAPPGGQPRLLCAARSEEGH